MEQHIIKHDTAMTSWVTVRIVRDGVITRLLRIETAARSIERQSSHGIECRNVMKPKKSTADKHLVALKPRQTVAKAS